MAERFLMWLGFGLCHQLPERSFMAGVLQVPVCARDTGIYVGFTASVIVLALLYRGKRPSVLPPWPTWVLLGLFVGAMVFDGFTSYAALRETTNELRLATGLLAGYAIGALTVPLLNGQVWARPGFGRVLATPAEVALWILSLPLSYLAVYALGPYLGAGLAFAVAASIVFTFFAIILVMVCLVPVFERRANRLSDLWVPALVALGVTGVVLAGGSTAKDLLLRVAGG